MGQKQGEFPKEWQAEAILARQAVGTPAEHSLAVRPFIQRIGSTVWYSCFALNPAAVLCGSSGSICDLSIPASVSSVRFQRNSN